MESRRRNPNIFSPLIHKVEGVADASPAQVLMVTDFLGDPAANYLNNLGGQIKIEKATFGNTVISPSDESCIEFTPLNFFYTNFGRIVSFEADTTSHYSSAEPFPSNLIQRSKSLVVSFHFEKDFHKVRILEKLTDWNYRKHRPRLRSLLRLADQISTHGQLNQSERSSGEGLRADGLTFLRHMQRFIKLIDQSCDIALYTADEQRARIYTKAFQGCPNIYIDEQPVFLDVT